MMRKAGEHQWVKARQNAAYHQKPMISMRYPFIVEAAELVDKRYPIKGMDVWRPYGWKTMKLIDSLTHKEMERTGHEVNFPLLIPEILEKENALVARPKRREEGIDPDDLRDEDEEGGFKKEVYWVKHAGENELDIPMFLRPTSETAMYTMFPLWIRSHRSTNEIIPNGKHLPIRNQANQVVYR